MQKKKVTEINERKTDRERDGKIYVYKKTIIYYISNVVKCVLETI